jgi:serine protease Do
LRLKISMMAPGAIVKLKLLRDRQESEVAVTLAESPASPQSETGPSGQSAPGPRLGISVDQITPQIARQLGLPSDTRGVVVTDVTPGSAAEEGGVQRGDIIEEVDRKAIATTYQFQRAIRQSGNQSVLLLINRGGNHVYTVLSPR